MFSGYRKVKIGSNITSDALNKQTLVCPPPIFVTIGINRSNFFIHKGEKI
jgi:hypothetical protein